MQLFCESPTTYNVSKTNLNLKHISDHRFAPYETAVHNSPEDAFKLYQLDRTFSAALFKDISYIVVSGLAKVSGTPKVELANVGSVNVSGCPLSPQSATTTGNRRTEEQWLRQALQQCHNSFGLKVPIRVHSILSLTNHIRRPRTREKVMRLRRIRGKSG